MYTEDKGAPVYTLTRRNLKNVKMNFGKDTVKITRF